MRRGQSLTDYFYNIFTIRQKGGRLLNLTRIEQWQTYGGWLEGLPEYIPLMANEWLNEIERIHGKTIIIGDAAVSLPLSEEGRLRYQHNLRGRRKHSLTSLAPVTCFGIFQSTPVVDVSDVSQLGVLWFQKNYALPIADHILSQIQALDWDLTALDFSL